MSSPLAIGAVSAVLRNLLDNGLIEAGPAVGGTVNVSAVAPDTIDLSSAEEQPRLNLFLHQVTPNPGWRNRSLPSRSSSSGERLTNAPLALDLHYLLTAYARVDCQAEILLGYGMHLLHERPVLDRAAVQRALNPNPLDVAMLPPAFQALAAADLADQAELIKITPAVMGPEEMSKLWAAIQSHYRPSAAYVVSVVLIEATKPARLAAAGAVARDRRPRDQARPRRRRQSRHAAAVADAVRGDAAEEAGRRAARRARRSHRHPPQRQQFSCAAGAPAVSCRLLNWCRALPTTTAPSSP